MRSDIMNGVLAGLVGGFVFGIMMQLMSGPTPDGGQMPMMQWWQSGGLGECGGRVDLSFV